MVRLYLLLLCLMLANISTAHNPTAATDSMQMQRLADSLRTKLAELKDYKTILDEKLSNKTAELENRQANFENRHYLLVWLISIFGLGAIIGVGAGYVFAKKIVQGHLIKLFEENNQDIRRLFIERSEERDIRRTKHIVVLSPVSQDEMISFQLKIWHFEKVTPLKIAAGEDYPDLTEVPDCLFLNNKSKGFDDRLPGIIEYYHDKFPQAILFYFGSKRLPEEMSEYVAMANLQTQIPGNLLNALKFRPTA